MNLGGLFVRAVKSGCICSIFYHVLMMLTGRPITVMQVATFTVVFIALYFLWLVLVSYKGRK